MSRKALKLSEPPPPPREELDSEQVAELRDLVARELRRQHDERARRLKRKLTVFLLKEAPRIALVTSAFIALACDARVHTGTMRGFIEQNLGLLGMLLIFVQSLDWL